MEEFKDKFEKVNGVKKKERSYSKEYDRLNKIIKRGKASPDELRLAKIKRSLLPSKDPMDPDFKRLMYVRYADDFVILIIGSKKDAENIKLKIAEVLFVRCKASLNMEKTVITHIRDGFDFLGANIRKLDNRVYKVKSVTKSGKSYARKVPLKLFVTAPISKIIDKLITRGFAKRNHKNKVIATGIPRLILKDHYSIIQYYNFIIRGLLNFFSFAGNYSSLHRVF
ncbi:hypothetical protein KL933_005340 [Ogataea haglerorum]|uniref:Reverse transcriptase domain-containing protein n=1 Tax=Ogataea haglerorum TaxID=1937702 RepID=A0AAN6D1E3_9ASCO|nr:uncharacterized protein KL911_005381 [Ogataea haglerorum]KAG7691330.1 hypothetical protein KL915_005370 [Ogataea haglerorum]KAG7702146.1 hypothetical protein KL950_005385 [Ogataea haglerorum]KAG7702147.1 hypothetical protein KL914_005372 [Ogataea haglerorum]KAG7712949.1 hypothetical protein KL949_005373 [Ogataea haglerorum]KAG7712994.1 hypothetical protein KL913_005383 [Ogataea haglerorum]